MMIAFHTLPGVCLNCAGPLHDEDIVMCIHCNDHDHHQAHQQRVEWFVWLSFIPIATLLWIAVVLWMLFVA